MQFQSRERLKHQIKTGLSCNLIRLHLPRFVTEENVEEVFSDVPEVCRDKFEKDVLEFDPTQEWWNTEYPKGLPPADYIRGMAVLREYILARRHSNE